MRKFVGSLMMSLAFLCPFASPATAALFTDDFNTDSSASYTIATSSADTAVTFAFDYSALGIPVAPNTTDGTTLGLKMEANIQTPTGVEAVTLHTNQTFTGPIRITFDAWVNANGPFPAGGNGSTEFLTAGVGGDGSSVNLGATTGSGGWTAVSGEGGSTRDYRMYKGSGEQFAESGQFAAGTSSAGGGAHNSSDPYYSAFGDINVDALAQGGNQTGNTAVGSFGFAWHEVELVVGNGTMTWSIDGLEIGTLDAAVGDAFNTDGSATIGYMDIFTSVSDAPQFSFGLVDNFSVTAVPEPSSSLVLLFSGLLGGCWRYRRSA